jgi:uncharacterized protein YutE (UPF0331/DUF86 family)
LADAPRIDSRLGRLDELLASLEVVHERGRGAYDGDPDVADATRYRLQLAVQVCIDLAAHLVARSGRRIPDRYKDLFTDLVADGLEPKLASRLSEAAGFRNVIVHDYLDVDDEVVWGSLDHLDDLRDFAGFVVAQLD